MQEFCERSGTPPLRGQTMTTIRQLIQTSPAKANDLFAKLVDTSETAVKTRDRLFSDLKAELELQAKLEEQHLFPVLKKHKETKDLVTDALNGNRQTGKLLAELERTPKDSEAFAAKVAELRKAFQQHVRDEKKELLPAVVKALSGEEASAVVEKIEDGKAEVEAARRAEAEERRAEIKREREETEAERQAVAKLLEREKAEAGRRAESERERKEAEAAQQAEARHEREEAEAARQAEAKQAEIKREREKLEEERQAVAKREHEEAEAARQAADASTDTVKAGAEVARQGATLARMATKAGADAAGAMGRAARAAAPSEDEQAAAPEMVQNEMAQDTVAIGTSMAALLGEQARHAMEAATALGRARTLTEVVRVQSDFIGGSVQRAGRMNERYLAFVRSGMTSLPFLPRR